jgi:hypothetical protein
MGCVKRRLVNVLAVVSMVICTVAAALWTRSHWYFDGADYYSSWHTPRRYTFSLYSGDGVLCIEAGRLPPARINQQAPRPGWEYDSALLDDPMGPNWQAIVRADAHFAYGIRSGPGAAKVYLPYYFICALTAIVPLYYVKHRGWRHISNDQCRHCGYDLRATPDRCPECGTIPDNSPPLARSR